MLWSNIIGGAVATIASALFAWGTMYLHIEKSMIVIIPNFLASQGDTMLLLKYRIPYGWLILSIVFIISALVWFSSVVLAFRGIDFDPTE